MYLEETEQSAASGEGTLLNDTVLSEQSHVAKLTENNGNAEFDGNVLVEGSELLVASRDVSPSKLCMGHCKDYEGKGNSEQSRRYSEFGSILECVTIPDKTLRLSQPLEGWHWRPSRTFEPCVNHSSAHNGSHCYNENQQQIFQQPEPIHHSFEHMDLAVEKSDVNSEHGETSSCTSKYIEQLELSQLYNPSGMQYECLECEPETSNKDCEKHETSGLVPDASESANESDCDTELSEYDDIQNRSMAADNNEERGYFSNSSQERGSDDELCAVSEDVNCLHQKGLMQVYFDENEGCSRATDHLNTRGHEDLNETNQTSEQNDSEKTFVGFFMEDDSSDGSSESKSFKTCADESENSLDSLGSESEKETQEYSSDEQTQWESFDDDEEQWNITERVHVEKKTSNFVLEDYFDLFDRGDYYGPTFTQPQHYISCFDGGDIHDSLCRDQQKTKKQQQNAYYVPEINPEMTDKCFYSLEKDLEGIYGCESSLRSELETQHENWKAEQQLDGDGHEEPNVNSPKTCNVTELMNLVKGDATDDILRVTTENKKPSKETPNMFHSQEAMFRACSEQDSYLSLRECECETLELIEEYYTSQIKSLQGTSKQSLNGLVVLNNQRIGPRVSLWSENHSISSQSQTEFQQAQAYAAFPEESQIDKVNEYCLATGERPNSNNDSSSTEILKQVQADIIHSVVSEYDKTDEGDALMQNRRTDDVEDENCDRDADELCDCEYCVPPNTQVPAKSLLPQLKSHDTGKICVVIDLDETLVHSSFTPVNNADFITPVDIDGTVHQVYVSKRPHVDEFLRRMGEMFECVLFTASLSKYADPVSDVLDQWGAFRSRLFREACVFHKGNYVKDLSHLGRDLNKVIIIDNSPASYIFHPDNAVPVVSWFDDTSDSELLDLIPFFERLTNVDDIYDVLKEQRSLG